MGAELLQSLFRHKAAIDDEFLLAVDRIDAVAQADDRRVAIRLMNHIHVVDRIFSAHLRGDAHGYDATNTPATPAVDALRWAMSYTDLWLIEHAGRLTPAQLAESVVFTFTDGQSGRMSREEMLMHLIGHGSYHRGGVGGILSRHSIPAPRDLFTSYLHRAEPQRREPV